MFNIIIYGMKTLLSKKLNSHFFAVDCDEQLVIWPVYILSFFPNHGQHHLFSIQMDKIVTLLYLGFFTSDITKRG